MKTYLLNTWYAAAWSAEIANGKLFGRRLLDTPVVFYRDSTGKMIALHDRCPHRFAKLSYGTLIDDKVRCIYHGLEFNAHGACVANALPFPVPRKAQVRTFPVVEQDKLVWIWMGDPEAADAKLIPRLEYHNDPNRRMVYGMRHSKADYMLYNDNLMDLTHIVLLHPVFDAVGRDIKFKTWEEGNDVIAYYSTLEPDQEFHLTNEIRWYAPANLSLETRICDNYGKGRWVSEFSANVMTPDTDNACYYFWSLSVEAGDPNTDEQLQARMEKVLDEDEWMIEGVQQGMGDKDIFDLNPILLGTDAGAVRMRRKLAKLIADETKQQNPSAAALEQAVEEVSK